MKKLISDPLFVEFLYDISDRDDDFYTRNVIVSAYYLSSVSVAGVVITVSGTPPKTTVYLPLHGSHHAIVNSDPAKMIGYNDDYDRLVGFLKRHDILDENLNVLKFEDVYK